MQKLYWSWSFYTIPVTVVWNISIRIKSIIICAICSHSCLLQSLCRTRKRGRHSFGVVHQKGSFRQMYGYQFCGYHSSACVQGPTNPYLMEGLYIPIRILYRIFILRKNPLKGDYTHFHHRLLGLGLTRGETRAFIRIWSLMMMVLMLLQWANRFSKVVIFVMMAMLFFGVNWYLFIYKKLPCGLAIQKER